MPGDGLLHALYYLAKVLGYDVGYEFRYTSHGVYSEGIEGDRALGKLPSLPREAIAAVSKILGCNSNCGYRLVVAANLHYIATKLYPPVDDPVEYYLARYPGAKKSEVEEILRRLHEAGLL